MQTSTPTGFSETMKMCKMGMKVMGGSPLALRVEQAANPHWLSEGSAEPEKAE